MSSLLEDPPMPTRSRDWGHYLLPTLVLLNVLLMLSLLGVLPPVFGDQPDPGRLSRQIDADRVRVVPGGAAAAEAASSAHSAAAAEAASSAHSAAAAQEGDKQADAAPQGTVSGNVQNASARSAAQDERQPTSASAPDRNASDRQGASARTADRPHAAPSGASRNSTSGAASARPRQDANRRQDQQAGNRSTN